MQPQRPSGDLLGAGDPAPVEFVNPDSRSEVFLLCEHAGQQIPHSLGDLGVSREVLDSHAGWDIGAGQLARALAQKLHAPLVLQRYSRLVVDCNRPPCSPESSPAMIHGIAVPGNQDLSVADLLQRQVAILDPMDRAVAQALSAHPRQLACSIHSYTPELNGFVRPWHAGFLSRRSLQTADALRRALKAQDSSLNVAINAPYIIDSDSDRFVVFHLEPRGLAHALIEVRNDLLRTPSGIALWAERLEIAIHTVLESIRTQEPATL